MDLLTVVIIASIIAIVCFFVGRKFGSNSTSNNFESSNPVTLDRVSEDTEKKLKSKIDELKSQVADMDNRLKEKDEMLKSALAGDVSDLSSSLQVEIDNLKKKVDKLKKELDDAEDERDDFEDEAKSIKKKLEKKTTEYKELSTKMEDITRKFESLQRDFNTTVEELEEVKVQNKEREESIEFVNAILNAKEASDEYTKSRNEAIDNVRNTLWNYFDSLAYWDLEDNRDNIPYLASHWANERKKPWLKGKKVIALVGEFSAGKTSIVNRILSQDDPSAPKLPTNSKATTAIPTYISYGPAFISQFLDASGTLKNIKKDDFERVKKDVLSKVNVSSLLEYFVMSYNNANLKGITILDTPGFSSNDSEDERRTCEVINEADILFWVFDVNQAINKSSITIIKENIKDVPLFVVMNKCDLLSPNELNAKENNLREILKKEKISIKGVIRFSEESSIDVIMKAVSSVACKKDDDEVSLIMEDLYSLYDTINNDYKEWQEILTKQKRNLEITEENIQFYLDQYQEDASAVGNMPQHESHFFSRDCFEISEDDFEEFSGRCQRMLDNRESFETEISDLKEFSENVTKAEKYFSDLKLQRKMLQDYENKIIEALKKFDKNYNIPVHVASSQSESNTTKKSSKQENRQNSSRSTQSHSQTNQGSSLRPVKTGKGFADDLRTFKSKNNEDFLLKADILYLAEQYGLSENMALSLAQELTKKIY